MRRNGRTLRVLVSGDAPDELEKTLADQPALSTVRLVRDGTGMRLPSSVDVALHVVSSSEELSAEISKLRSLSDVPLILAAYGEPNGIVEAGLDVGATDVVLLPQPIETLLFSLRKAAIASGGDKRAGRVITVFSPKGGTGKTVLATNIAVAATRSGLETVLLDLDLQFGDAALALAIPPRATIADLAASSGPIDIEKLKAFVCADSRTGLALLAAPKRPEEAQIVGQSELAAILDAARSAYDAIIIDTGPLFDGPMLAALDRSDRVLLVSYPEVTSLKNVRIGLETIDRLGFPRDRVSIVANRLGAPGGVSLHEMEEALEAEIAFEIPDDAVVPETINRATPAVLVDGSNRFSRAVSELATMLFSGTSAPAASGGQPRRSLLRGRR